MDKPVTFEQAMQLAIKAWHSGDKAQARNVCEQILAVRPHHKGARHLHMTLEHGVQAITFTAIHLNNPSIYDIGDFSYGVPAVFPHNQASEPARLIIGKYCTIGHDVKVYLGSYHRQDWFTIYPFSVPLFGSLFSSTLAINDFSCTRGGVSIGNDVWIGAHSIILSGVSIGDGAVIGAGSVVSRNVPPYEIWAGNPARFVKRRFDEKTSERLLCLRWWDWSKSTIEKNVQYIMSGTADSLNSLDKIKCDLIEGLNSQNNGIFVAGRTGILRFKLPEVWKADAPTALILHESLGCIESVQNIEHYLAEINTVFVDIPGFGHSWPPPEVTVESIAKELFPAVCSTIPPSYFIIGSSFGGAIGLQLAHLDSRCQGVVLIDTPLSSLKLWQNHQFLRSVISSYPDNSFIRAFALNIYGVTESAALERDYWYLLDGLRIPVAVVTGSIPMFPRRQMPPVPCCLDSDDLNKLLGMGCSIKQINGGHDLINDNPTDLARVIVELIGGLG